jgi:exopolyphosphatase / guanosine-5'-triphosphate,3'-diphosphate pyrophosphatase
LKEFKKTIKYATIDIGSNAIRLLISNIYIHNSEQFSTKNSLVRVPIRLGQDAFKNGEISKKNISRLLDSMKSFKLLMKVHDVDKYIAYATSALRSSSNRDYIISLIKKKANIKIEVITGKKEARLITNNPPISNINKSFCFIDVGGGSTELTLIKNNEVLISQSFEIGGVRLINNLVNKSTWNKFGNWIENNLSSKRDIEVVALGGNINKIFKLSGTKLGKPLSLELIDSTISDLEKMSFFDKMINLKLNPDRVDVIVPAGKIYQFVLNKMNVEKITVPKIGLADGMIYELMKKL